MKHNEEPQIFYEHVFSNYIDNDKNMPKTKNDFIQFLLKKEEK